MILLIYVLVTVLIGTGSGNSAELVYPASSLVTSSYEIANLSPEIGDTIKITRTLVNNESYALTGVYLSDDLPDSLVLISFIAQIKGAPISVYCEAGISGDIKTGHTSYRWIVDDPTGSQVNNVLATGDSLHLEQLVICPKLGEFVLDFHGTTSYNNGTGLFIVGDQQLTLRVSTTSDVNDDENLLPALSLTATAYPNPFNSTATIAYSANGQGEISLIVYDILGRRVYQSARVPSERNGTISWDADQMGSGMYLYRVVSDKQSVGGKLILLK